MGHRRGRHASALGLRREGPLLLAGTYRPRLLSTSLTTGSAAGPTVVDGDGVWLTLSDGRRVLDASNTAAPLGHKHPEIVQAIRESASAPVVNEGWGWPERQSAADE